MSETLMVNPNVFTPKEAKLALDWVFETGLMPDHVTSILAAFVASRRNLLDEISSALDDRLGKLHRQIDDCPVSDSGHDRERELAGVEIEVQSIRTMLINMM